MHTITLRRHIGADGKLEIELPQTLHNTDVEMVVVLNPVSTTQDWPMGYFERTFGALKDVSFERPSQGDYETREEF